MESYVTGKIIKELREKKNLTQRQLADILRVSDKTISKWETGKGFPDISLIEPISAALNVSTFELLNGEYIENNNKNGNIKKSSFSVCPICQNIVWKMGESIVSCCGINLPRLEAENEDDEHVIGIEYVEDEIYISLKHDMNKQHYISFIAYVTCDRCEIVKLYKEQNAEARFLNRGKGTIYVYCNKDGLIMKKM